MKTAGIIGGLSPASTVVYYNALNRGVQERLGGHHSAKILLSSVDFGESVALKEQGEWGVLGTQLAGEAQRLERAGADFILMATNTMHKVADRVKADLRIPFLHLADATARRIKSAGLTRVALLGTRYTMTLDFYKERLAAHGITALVPDEQGIETVDRIIYDELCREQVRPESKAAYQALIADLAGQGAQGVILGCTEITLLIGPDDVDIPVFDTTAIHVEEAMALMFDE